MYEKLALYIDGAFIEEGRKTEPVVNPATGEVLAQLPHATREDLDRALRRRAASVRDAGRRPRRSSARPSCAKSPSSRANAPMRSAATSRSTRASRSPKPSAKCMVCAEHAEWHAEECRRIYGRVIPPRRSDVRQFVLREPVGVCAAFTPWNFPFNQAIRKMVAALGAGCTLVLKGPETAPERGRRARAALSRRRPAGGLPEPRLGRAERDLRVPDQVADRAQSVVYRAPSRSASNSPRWRALT